jgi:hypothetical protein
MEGFRSTADVMYSYPQVRSRKEKAMARVESGKRKGIPSKRTSGLSKKRLAELVEEATVDAHDESEQATGFYTMMEDDLRLPFTTD